MQQRALEIPSVYKKVLVGLAFFGKFGPPYKAADAYYVGVCLGGDEVLGNLLAAQLGYALLYV